MKQKHTIVVCRDEQPLEGGNWGMVCAGCVHLCFMETQEHQERVIGI